MAKSLLKQTGMVLKGCNNNSGGISLSGTPPAVSTRHLLGDIMLFDDEHPTFTPVLPDRTDVKLSNEDHELKLAGSKSFSFPSKAGSDQMKLEFPEFEGFVSVSGNANVCCFVLTSSDYLRSKQSIRVLLHCRGCARKVRKHLSKMEGVTSFNIDFAAKKVTVIHRERDAVECPGEHFEGEECPVLAISATSSLQNHLEIASSTEIQL